MKPYKKKPAKKAVGAKTRWLAPPPHEVREANFDNEAVRILELATRDMESRLEVKDLTQLFRKAYSGITAGDSKAVENAILFLTVVIKNFNDAISLHPEIAREWAAKQSLWPVLSSNNPKIISANNI